VETEEEKRKALLQGRFFAENNPLKHLLSSQGSADIDEVFSWEDDEDDATASASLSKKVQSMNDSTSSEHTLGLASELAKKASAPSSQVATSATTSPRLSSEDSYDLVSSGNVSNAGEAKVRTKKGEDDDPDSDWE
jgi:hypothetical protein